MPNTDQFWQGDTPFPDQEIFVGATEFKDLSAVATLASAAAGLLTLNLATAAAGNFIANITAALKRTGVFASTNLFQQQYGTSASLPGPQQSLPNSNDPEGIRGFPPFTAAQLPTLIGAAHGAVAKGITVTSIDILYSIGAVNAALAQCGLTNTNFIDNNAATPTVANLIALAANSMPVAFRTNYYRFNVPVPTAAQQMLTSFDSELIANVKLTAGSGGTINFYGIVAKCNFNFQ